MLESDLGSIVKIVGVVVAVVMFIILPQKELEKAMALQAKDINTITTNHLSHIQDSIKIIEEELKAQRLNSEANALAFAKHQMLLEEVMKSLKK